VSEQARAAVLDQRGRWQALCGFLERPVPAVLRPRVNDSRIFSGMVIVGAMQKPTAWWSQQ